MTNSNLQFKLDLLTFYHFYLTLQTFILYNYLDENKYLFLYLDNFIK